MKAQKTLAEANVLVSQGQADLAIKILSGFLVENPTSTDVQARLNELILSGNEAEDQNPGLEILNNLNILLRAGSVNSVEQNTTKLLHFFPKSPKLWTMLAKTYLALAKLDSAKLAADISCQLT